MNWVSPDYSAVAPASAPPVKTIQVMRIKSAKSDMTKGGKPYIKAFCLFEAFLDVDEFITMSIFLPVPGEEKFDESLRRYKKTMDALGFPPPRNPDGSVNPAGLIGKSPDQIAEMLKGRRFKWTVKAPGEHGYDVSFPQPIDAASGSGGGSAASGGPSASPPPPASAKPNPFAKKAG